MRFLAITVLLLFSCYEFVYTNQSVYIKRIDGYVDEPKLPIYLRRSLENSLLSYGYSLVNSAKNADLIVELKILRYSLDNLGYRRPDNINNQKAKATYRAVYSRINLYADYSFYRKGEIFSKGEVSGSGDFYEYADLKVERSKAFQVASSNLSKQLVNQLLLNSKIKQKSEIENK